MDLAPGHYRILAYRGFYDVPRRMLVADEASRQWLLDCRFDEALDDYAPVYRIYIVPADAEADAEGAGDAWQQHALGLLREAGAVPVSAVRFDPTHRASVQIP